MKGKITVVGMGPGSFENLTCGALEEMEGAEKVYLRTFSHPLVPLLQDRGLALSGFDHLYEECETFDDVYEAIVAALLDEAEAGSSVVYAVPGHPLVAESSVSRLLREGPARGVEIRVVPGLSAVEAAYAALGLDPLDGVALVDALEIDSLEPDPAAGMMVLQIYNPMIASAVKLRLMETFPDDYRVKMLREVGTSRQRIDEMLLFEIDRDRSLDHLAMLYLPPLPEAEGGRMADLLQIMRRLRGPGGCPWDAQQSHRSLRPYVIEEAYEVLDALERDDVADLVEELGDLLLQVVFHAQIAAEEGTFNFADVVAGINRKLKRRHPHVFADTLVSGAGEVLRNWEVIKLSEREEKGGPDKPASILQGVPRMLPALTRAQKVQAKAARVGFDWPDTEGVLDKIGEEVRELSYELQQGDSRKALLELGDLLFALVNLARKLDLDAEESLRLSTDEFIRRFNFVEEAVRRSGRSWESFSLQEMDEFWDEAKRPDREGISE